MQYIPPIGPQGPANAFGNGYVDKNAGAGIAGSFLSGFVPEHTQVEILNAIAKSGLTPTNTTLDQLARAVRSQALNYTHTPTGTANAPIVTLDPAPAALIDLRGTPIRIRMAATNTSTMTLTIAGVATAPVINHDGTVMAANDILAFSIREFIFDGVNFRVMPVLTWPLIDQRIRAFLANTKPAAVRTYTANDTWSKPANLNYVRARVSGGGASGGMSSGSGGAIAHYWGGAGGNAGYIEAYILSGDLGATQAVTVGAGGVARTTGGGVQNGAAGGNSQFSFLFSAGGQAGGGVTGAPGAFGDGGGFTINTPAVGFGVQGVRGQPGDFFGIPMPAILGLQGRGGNGGSIGAGADGIAGSTGIVIIEEYLLG